MKEFDMSKEKKSLLNDGMNDSWGTYGSKSKHKSSLRKKMIAAGDRIKIPMTGLDIARFRWGRQIAVNNQNHLQFLKKTMSNQILL